MNVKGRNYMKDYAITNYIYYSRIKEAIGNEEELKNLATELSNRQDFKEVSVTEDSVLEDDKIIERINMKIIFSNTNEELTITVKSE